MYITRQIAEGYKPLVEQFHLIFYFKDFYIQRTKYGTLLQMFLFSFLHVSNGPLLFFSPYAQSEE